MNCPVCQTPLVILELNNVEIDHCTTCDGIWLDGSEVEIMLENVIYKEEFFSSFKIVKNSSEKKLKCPICRRKMAKVLCGKNENILIDKCKKHHGLWFDRGELEQLLESGEFDKDNKILNLIKEMFEHKLKLNRPGE
ncbi:MAG TPA: hypothetical protein ENI76_03020 [Ignavibacteria bacterium]|nr:hypothetical protein [Ignavibacteria bacterium]